MKKLKLIAFVLAIFASCSISWAKTPKYVFFMIGDGMGVNEVAAAEYYMQQMGLGELNFRHFPVFTMVSTHSASSLVTDSAAAGTALACGVKTRNGMLGMLPDSTIVRSLTEKAKAKGYGTGVITSDGLTQATPSAFSVHVASRNDSDGISTQMVDSDVDFLAGSTLRSQSFTVEQWIAKAQDKGMEVFYGDKAYSPVKGKRVMYLSDNTDNRELPYVVDMHNGERRLGDFTEAAIDYLYSNFSNGFFLMVEAANVDHASHSRDAGAAVAEIIDFSYSIDQALKFYDKHPDETLIIVTTDHETGACAITGSKQKLLANQHSSISVLTQLLSDLGANGREASWSEVKKVLKDNLGLWDAIPVDRQEERILTELYKQSFLDRDNDNEKDLYHSNKKLAVEAVRYFDHKAGLECFHGSHTAAPVGLFVKGAKAAEFSACRDNTDIPATVCRVAGYK